MKEYNLEAEKKSRVTSILGGEMCTSPVILAQNLQKYSYVRDNSALMYQIVTKLSPVRNFSEQCSVAIDQLSTNVSRERVGFLAQVSQTKRDVY